MSARQSVWLSLEAPTEGSVRAIFIGEAERGKDLLGALNLIAMAAECSEMADVALAARQRIAAMEEASDPQRDQRALAPLPVGRLNDLANALHVFATAASDTGMSAEAEWACQMAGDLYVRLEGAKSRSYIVSLSALSAIYTRAGFYDEASTSASLAWQLSQEVGGLDVADEAGLLVNLGGARSHRGLFDESADFYERACTLLAPLDDHAEQYALALNNLGAANVKQGRVAEAQAQLKKALALRQRVLGDTHPGVADTLMNLAHLASDLHRWAAALSLYEEALEIRRATWPALDHPLTAQSMSSLANALHWSGEVEVATQLGEEALAMRRRLFSDVAHNDLAESLNNVAHMHAVAGRFEQAEQLWMESVAVMQAAVGYDFPELAKSFDNLAQLYSAQGDYEQARPAAQAAVRIASGSLGEGHQEVAAHLGTLGVVRAMAGDRAGALDSLRDAIRIQDAAFWRVARMSSAHGRAIYATGTRGVADAFLSVLFSGDRELSPEEVVEAADLILRRKRLEGETLAVQREALRSDRHRELEGLARALADARGEIARLELSGDRGDPEGYERALLEVGLAQEQIETELAARIPELDLGPLLESISAEGVRSRLSGGTALVEIIRIDDLDLDLRPGAERYGQRRAGSRYIAMVLRSDLAVPQAVSLGDADAIDQMIDGFRAAIITGSSELRVGAALRGELLDRLIPLVGEASRVYLAPDGDLFELPFDALPIDGGRRLIDLWEITYLATGRDLLRTVAGSSADAGAPLVVADPDFDLGDTGTTGSRPAFDCSALSFEPLEGTRREAQRVAAALEVEALVGPRAVESAVKGRRSPRVLHIATHGFFLPPDSDLGGDEPSDGGALSRPMPPNPLLRSGLVLAGARTWCRGGICTDEAEDGVLTAEDVASLDLFDTGLVVLSACESGLGQIQTGEGVHGLRRAFELAGAQTVVMSLWKVGDEVTETLMGQFYDALVGGLEPASALRQAQTALRVEHPDRPFVWAAFVCQGVKTQDRC